MSITKESNNRVDAINIESQMTPNTKKRGRENALPSVESNGVLPVPTSGEGDDESLTTSSSSPAPTISTIRAADSALPADQSLMNSQFKIMAQKMASVNERVHGRSGRSSIIDVDQQWLDARFKKMVAKQRKFSSEQILKSDEVK